MLALPAHRGPGFEAVGADGTKRNSRPEAGRLSRDRAAVPAKRRQRLAAVYDEEMSGWGRQGGSAAMGWPVDMVMMAGQGEGIQYRETV